MFEWPTTPWQYGTRERPPASPAAAAADLARHFRENYPVMLDGALPRPGDRGYFTRNARRSLVRGTVDSEILPSAVLRETLESLKADPVPVTHSGFTAIGPRHARVWWDESVVNNLDDVLASLDKPVLILRFYDVTGLDPEAGRWHDSFDVEVELDHCGRTVQFWSSDRTYIVDLGYVHADGRFLRLARTNTADLPRESAGEAGDEAPPARSGLRRRRNRRSGAPRPDAAAREWAATRPDSADRDLEAELAIHMIYRAFLREGPRALRRATGLARRDAADLRREFLQRERTRERRTAPTRSRAFLVTRLDEAPVAVTVVGEPGHAAARLLPAVASASRLAVRADAAGFSWLHSLLAVARMKVKAEPDRPRATATVLDPSDEVLTPVAMYQDGVALPLSVVATPVFEAARHLRDSMSGLRPSESARLRDIHMDARRDDADAVRIFGGSEAKRMAKAGVRFTRMALTLEGRMRPGARLKVAGKLVHADAQGNFRLECVLSGRRASIPMRAGASVEGEARSLINVDWEKRPGRERRNATQ